MPLQESDYNVQTITIEPTTLIDQVSTTEFFLGTSRSFKDLAKPNWRIKRIWQVGTVWFEGYPNGNQDFVFIWDSRGIYAYS